VRLDTLIAALRARLTPRLLRRLGRVVGATVLGLGVLYGLLRVPMAHYAYGQLQQRLAARGLALTAGGVAPFGVVGLRLDTVVVCRGADTLARAGRLAVALRLRYLLLGQAAPAELRLSQALIALPDSFPDTARARRDTIAASNVERAAPELGRRLSRLAEPLLPLLSAEVRLRQVHLLWGRGPDALHLALDSLAWGGGLPAAGALSVNGQPYALLQRADTLWVETARTQLLTAPPLRDRLALRLGLRRLGIYRFEVNAGRTLSLSLGLRAEGLQVQQHRLSRGAFGLDTLALALRAEVGPARVLLDSSTRVSLNGLAFAPYVLIDLMANGSEAAAPDTLVEAHLRGPDTTAQAYVSALTATGLFTTLKGMQVDGRWRHAATLRFDSRRPDTLAFTSAMNARGFRVRRWGSARLTALADTFSHRPPGTRLRRLVGPPNPDFVPLAELPADLPNAVLTSEDPSFRWHNGFSEQAIGESILQNYRQRRFARGGSTLTMQLVKNVYLSGDKHIARKLEEALLVWMLEQGRLVPKERLLEVYLNIIEWAPDRYGIRQAAEFYFGKGPETLDLAECIFLAMVIPRPKKFYFHFDATGEPRANVAAFRDLIARLMLSRRLIGEDQAALVGLMPLRLGPAARDYVREHYAATPSGSLQQQLERELDQLDEDDPDVDVALPDSLGGR